MTRIIVRGMALAYKQARPEGGSPPLRRGARAPGGPGRAPEIREKKKKREKKRKRKRKEKRNK